MPFKLRKNAMPRRFAPRQPTLIFRNVILGGEGEIRTRGPLRANGFQDRRTRPLCDLSIHWRKGWDSNPGAPLREQSLANFCLNHSATLPYFVPLRSSVKNSSYTIAQTDKNQGMNIRALTECSSLMFPERTQAHILAQPLPREAFAPLN